MKYLKLFNQHDNYEDYTVQDDFIMPNVSHCTNIKCVHYNPRRTLVTAKVNTGDFERIVGGIGEIPESANFIQGATYDPYEVGIGCYHYNNGYYFYKHTKLVQRTDGNEVNLGIYLYDDYKMALDVLVSYDSQEAYNARTSHDVVILLSQDGSFVKLYTYRDGRVNEYDTPLPQVDKYGFPMYDGLGNEIPYTGAYDVEYAYPALIMNGNMGSVMWDYEFEVYQDDGVPLPSDVGIFFSETDFMQNYYYSNNTICIGEGGSIMAVSENGEIMVDGNGDFITENVVPKFDANGDIVVDGNDEIVYYNGRYKVTTPEEFPFVYIKVDGKQVNIPKLLYSDYGFYEFVDGVHDLEYGLKERKVIPEYAFNKCVALEEVRISKKIETIDASAFDYCPLLGTSEEEIMRICSVDGKEPIVVEADFDFEDGEEKTLQMGTRGVFSQVSSEEDYIPEVHYFTINNGVVADVDCNLYYNEPEK